MKTIPICGIKHSVLDYDEAISIFDEWINKRDESRQVCISNVHTTVLCQTDEKLAETTNNAAMVTMDGQPLRWYANLVHKAGLKDRVSGPDLMQRCIEAGLDKCWKHFFLGGTEEVVENLYEKLTGKYPEVRIVGHYSPPFRPWLEKEDDEIIEKINSSHADFLWVGLGAPKQEKWISKNLNRIHVPVQIGVGASFDFHSDHIKRAPIIMRAYGLEWLYRITQDHRLLRRYLTTNPNFLYMFLRDYIRAKNIMPDH